jgi:hypothetical protein
MHSGKLRLSLHRLGIVVEHGKPAEALLEPLGYRHLSDHTPKDQLPGRIEKPVGQGVDDIIQARASAWSSAFGGSGRPLPGTRGTSVRSAAERRGMTPTTLHHPARNPKNLARNPLKGQHPSATSRNPGKNAR